jgi:Fe2+ or Zn2+ uptake regulation protein
LKGSGLRCTRRRYAVMAFVLEYQAHPTAAEISKV